MLDFHKLVGSRLAQPVWCTAPMLSTMKLGRGKGDLDIRVLLNPVILSPSVLTVEIINTRMWTIVIK